jgi:hypothetical protein
MLTQLLLLLPNLLLCPLKLNNLPANMDPGWVTACMLLLI